MKVYDLVRPVAFALNAERAHRTTVAALKYWPGRRCDFPPSLETQVAGLTFPSPVGLGAGFDKDGEVFDAMLSLGFGFVEIGTVTPCPQAGNAKPRLFRLAEDNAVINRMGFNNRGHDAALDRLKNRIKSRGLVGVNIGANKDSADRISDYVRGVQAMSGVADYLTVNISSPNTPGLRSLQDHGALDALLGAIEQARDVAGPPVFLKVAPDLEDADAGRIVASALRFGIDALIVGNTTISRPPLKSRYAGELGGLSGDPLKPIALDALRRFRSATGGAMPLIGCGGISSADDAWDRICAGANLVQLYTAMVYDGPGVARAIAAGLARKLQDAGFDSIADAVGSE